MNEKRGGGHIREKFQEEKEKFQEEKTRLDIPADKLLS